MTESFKPSSECADCGLCALGQRPVPGNDSLPINRIVREVVRRVRQNGSVARGVPVGVSARHCHLSREAMDLLFGPGFELTHFRNLYQPSAFAAGEVVSVVGPRMRAIERIRILGPLRNYTQVELSRTDAIFLGLDLPVRDSGDIQDAKQATLIGPKGAMTTNAAIRAARHIHLNPSDVERLGLRGRSSVRVRVGGEKGLTFENARLKIDDSFIPEIHLDTDDANAADLICGDIVHIEP